MAIIEGTKDSVQLVFSLNDGKPLAPSGQAIQEEYFASQWAEMMTSGLNSNLRDTIIDGAANPSQVVSDRISLAQASTVFAKFKNRVSANTCDSQAIVKLLWTY